MIRNVILGLTLLFGLTNCTKEAKTAEQTDSDTTKLESFPSVYDTLFKMEIPITLTPSSWDELIYKHVDNNRGELTTDHPFAKLIDTKNYKGVIFISTDETGSPVLFTFDRDGKEIDGMRLLGDWGGNGPSNGTSEIMTISKDLTIHLIDSISTWDVGPDGSRIDSTRQLRVKDELYKISDTGKIIKIR
ncbi:MAG TPA: hypothetical protein PLX35_15690 [Cyclobacteriaceae bacterium]|nr:hypothetical protein [Cyclobacteriaceae bacterium]